MLYLVATPIGNLADITFRAVETLKAADYILCEDTRHSLRLLLHYDIKKPLFSYHKFNEKSKAEKILQDLRKGLSIALVSDAGTPGISDPGNDLVRLCVEEGLPVTSIPGPCAAIAALSSSGLETARFQFTGFLPRKNSEMRKSLTEILTYPGTTICYESPKRILPCLKMISQLDPNRIIAIARELTKKFEETKRGTASELLRCWQEKSIKGEIVLLIKGKTDRGELDYSDVPPDEHVKLIQQSSTLTLQEAIKLAAAMRGVSKREIYRIVHRSDSESEPI